MTDVKKIRNIAVTGHGKAGKTTLVEAMLFTSGVTDRMGRTEDGTTVTDFEPEETEKQMSLSSALAFCEHDGNRINIVLHSPDFTSARRVAEAINKKHHGYAQAAGYHAGKKIQPHPRAD